ncbi:MAG: sigma-70 family RNA polymerase sigma factor [Pirellulaceae bacterium]|nr:sigma-70 family RNA polymerase sigma factor [Pirellulaceae bacterium]
MKATSLTLLQSASSGSELAWERLNAIYRPFVYGWFRYRCLAHEAAEDLTQEVMLVVARELPRFEHLGRAGSFRGWLRQIASFEELAYRRKMSRRRDAVGGTDFHDWLQELADGGASLELRWNQQHDRHVLTRLLAEVSADFDDRTMRVFQRLAVDGAEPSEVAGELEMSIGAVYAAKSRVVRRLRAEAAELLGD